MGGMLIGFFRRLLKDRRGNVLAIACASMPLVIGAAGLATDTIEWTLWKRQLQRAADSAAFAGVYDRSAASGATSNTPTAVCRDLAVNLHTWMSLVGTSPCTGSVGSYTTLSYPADTTYTSNQVQVILRIQQTLPFSSLFMSSAPVITASATAGTVSSGGTPCMLATATSGTALDNSGGATINAATCILYSDSTSSNSAAAGGNSTVTAKAVAAVGGIQQSNNWAVQQYMPYSPPIADPFANVTPSSSDMHCAGHYVTSGGNGSNATTTWVYDTLTESTNMATATYLDSSGNVQTGANCWTSLSVGSNKSLTVPSTYSGPIYVDANSAHGGTGNVNFQGSFTCSSCSIVMTNSDPNGTTIGSYSTNAQAKTNIAAPTTGTFAGIAIYQDRRASTTSNTTNTVNGGSNNVIQGAVYFPNQTLKINGTGTAVSLCAMWVANNITFVGGSSIAVSSPTDTACSGDGMPSSAVQMVRLIA
jgi:hypothetical protein